MNKGHSEEYFTEDRDLIRMNHANVWLAPQCELALRVCINHGGDAASNASDAASAALIKIREFRAN